MKSLLIAFILILSTTLQVSSERTDDRYDEYTSWIKEMKSAARGPFKNIRWFCNDGSILPPEAYACSERGGGVQHGNYTEQTSTLRNEGYYIANFLADLNEEQAIAEPDFNNRYNQILLEKFLRRIDDGWILRKARFYRGAFQEETERKRARSVLMALSSREEWITYRYPGLRIGVRLLPHGKDTASIQKIRQTAVSLAENDPDFATLRVKIHGSPDAGDAQRVRDYAKNKMDKRRYLQLADEIDGVYQAPALSDSLRADARVFTRSTWLQAYLNNAAKALEEDTSTENQYTETARILADLRGFLPRIVSRSARLRILDLSLNVEALNFKASTELRQRINTLTRRERIVLLKNVALSAYGTGVINKRSLQQIQRSIALLDKQTLELKNYIEELNYLGRVPGWGTQTLRFQFYASMQKLGEIEPLVYRFIQDQLRAGPLLFFSQILNSLSVDAGRLSGVKITLFDEKVGVGIHALNPGLARGVLHTDVDIEQLASIEPDGIYVLPETVSDLPPLSGIITAGEGNPLSHVQLLARNLGIPNVRIDENLVSRLRKHDGETIVMAVSPSGLVEIMVDSEPWRQFFTENKDQGKVVIRPDLNKLDTQFNEFIDLGNLRAKDSGRIVGPKAAKLGELKHIYPDKVANGLAIPFGIFREVVLNKPYKDTTKTIFDWMLEQYAFIRSLESKPELQNKTAEAFRAELYGIILHTKIDPPFATALEKALIQTFGSTDIGVFVRSDTNVEDLPDFTGAGLNLTLPNVIGLDNLLVSISRVWASPFTQRAFAWRQSHMDQPQHVYPSILLQRSVPNDKSGVMVTVDIDTGDRGIVSIAVNEGVGGAVDGQSAESLRVSMNDATVRVLATASAPLRRRPSATGGLIKLAVSGAETLLQAAEIVQLIQLAKELPVKFPSIVDDQGNPAPADVEFGFLDGKLHLFQLRPFLQSHKAQTTDYLIKMDKALRGTLGFKLDMMGVPEP